MRFTILLFILILSTILASKNINSDVINFITTTCESNNVENHKKTAQVIYDSLNACTPINLAFRDPSCSRLSELINCVNTTTKTEAATSCFRKDQILNVKSIVNLAEQALKFACVKNGTRINLIQAEGAQECIDSNYREVENCFETRMGKDSNDFKTINAKSLKYIMEFRFDRSSCFKISELHICLVTVLETCERLSTANMVDALIKYVWKHTNCKNYMRLENMPSSSVQITLSVILSVTFFLGFRSLT